MGRMTRVRKRADFASSLASGQKHGYALLLDIEGFAGVRLGPGTFALRPEERRNSVAGTR